MVRHYISVALLLTCASLTAAPPMDAATRTKNIRGIIRQMNSDSPVEIQTGIIKLAWYAPADISIMQTAAADKPLKPAVAGAIKKFIALENSRQPARKRREEIFHAETSWIDAQALAAYDKFGHKDARWNDAARAAIKSWTENRKDPFETINNSNLAIKNGCDDPLIACINHLANGGSYESLAKNLATLGEDMSVRGYPAYWQMMCAHGAWNARRAELRSSAIVAGNTGVDSQESLLLKRLADAWSLAIKQGVPSANLAPMAKLFIDTKNPVERKAMFDAFFEPWEKARPDDPYMLTFKGDFYVQYAWDARGGDWAGKVTDDGWKQFGERLEIASQALTKAWEKNPELDRAPFLMLKVELGQGQGRDRLELWFRRTMDANPDSSEACKQKMLYLEPKWHGTPLDMIKFAHECYDTQNWHGALPFQIEVAYTELKPFVKNSEVFLGDPKVWNDIQSLYVPYLQAFPTNNWVRNGYARMAGEAGKWTVAKAQFDKLGAQANPAHFDSPEQMQALQAKARELGGLSAAGSS